AQRSEYVRAVERTLVGAVEACEQQEIAKHDPRDASRLPSGVVGEVRDGRRRRVTPQVIDSLAEPGALEGPTGRSVIRKASARAVRLEVVDGPLEVRGA